MTRYLYSICLLILGMGLPLHAVVGPRLPVESTSKPANKRNVTSATHSKDQSHKTTKTVVATTKPAPAPSQTSKQTLHASEPTATSARASSQGSVARMSSPSHSSSASCDRTASGERLARVTAYWAGEGDYYTGRGQSATGVRLHGGHCAVDPSIIPYGSVVNIAGVGKYLAVDTGSAVISREAAREAAHNSSERNALVIDLFFESRREGERFAANGPVYASISWTPPSHAKPGKALFADEDSMRFPSKQL